MPSGDKKLVRGTCSFFFETGAKGGYWAFEGEGGGDYKEPHTLKNGDYLKIYSPEDPEEVMWEGTISLRMFPPFSESVHNVWIHSEQIGISRKMWATWFIKEYPAELVPAQEE